MLSESGLIGEKFDKSIAYKLNLQEYDGLLRCMNEDNIIRLHKMMPRISTGNICIVAVGSDGKLERHSQSKTELAVFADSTEKGLKQAKVLSDYLKNHYPNEHFDFEPVNIPEYKTVGKTNILSYAYNDSSRTYPDRVINTVLIKGDPNIYQQARLQALTEIGRPDPIGKRIREKMKKQIFDHRTACTSGLFRSARIFDPNQFLQFYDEKQNIYGFKASFLRVVQRKLDLITANSILDHKLTPKKIVSDLPTYTIERIKYLGDNGIIDQALVDDLSDAYIWFLQRYHEAQQMYKDHKQGVMVKFNPELFNKYRKTILDFVS